jgi:YspA, cpYpsA-related SLOG family
VATRRNFDAGPNRAQAMSRPRGFRNQSYGAAGPCISLMAKPDATRIVVTGGRGYDNRELVYRSLDAALAKHGAIQIAEGGCPTGADLLAREWARDRRIPCTTFRADFAALGKRAGPTRNQKMINEFQPTGVIAFPGGVGTMHCVRCAKAANVPVWHPAALRHRSHKEERRASM